MYGPLRKAKEAPYGWGMAMMNRPRLKASFRRATQVLSVVGIFALLSVLCALSPGSSQSASFDTLTVPKEGGDVAMRFDESLGNKKITSVTVAGHSVSYRQLSEKKRRSSRCLLRH
jgi:hypothetical protein